MNKGLKVALNIVFGTGIGAAGYFLGFKAGKKKEKEWAMSEINSILKSKNEEIEELEGSHIADLGNLTPDILEKLEYGKADEVEVEIEPEKNDIPFDDPVEVKEESVKKAPKKKPKKTPYMIDETEYDETDPEYEHCILTIDENGDLYEDESDNLYDTREYVGETLVKRMLKDIEFGDSKEWYVRNEAMGIVFDITYCHSR